MSRLDNLGEILDSYEGRDAEIVSPVSFNGLEWQPKAYREPGETDKALLVFDASQEKLVKAGYERHPFSAEAFSLIIAHLEGKLSPKLDKMAEDMLTGGFGEFFCQAIETAQVSGRIIARIYETVTALPRNAANDGYDVSGMRMETFITKRFDVTDLKPGKYNYYKDIYVKHNDLIKYLTSRIYENLPDKIKKTGEIGLPRPGRVWPMGFDSCGSISDIGTGVCRGVRPVEKSTKKDKPEQEKEIPFRGAAAAA